MCGQDQGPTSKAAGAGQLSSVLPFQSPPLLWNSGSVYPWQMLHDRTLPALSPFHPCPASSVFMWYIHKYVLLCVHVCAHPDAGGDTGYFCYPSAPFSSFSFGGLFQFLRKESHYPALAGLEPRDLPASVSRALELKVCAATLGLYLIF